MKTVTPEQIERLYEFTREHYVEHYDLQSELVDHLANAIEKRWEETPEMDFEDCIKAEFKKFGIFGFMDVVEKRQKALRKKYRRLIWGQVVDFFQLPKILLTGGLTFLLYFAITLSKPISSVLMLILLIFMMLIFFVTFVRQYKLEKKYKARIEETGRRWVLEEMIFRFGRIPGFVLLLLQILVQAKIYNWTTENSYILFLVCLGVVVLGIFSYVSDVYLPKNAEKYLSETYPEYQLVEKS